MTAAPLARVGATDEFGIVTEAAKRRALYGERAVRGNRAPWPAVPGMGTTSTKLPREEPSLAMSEPAVIGRIAEILRSEALMVSHKAQTAPPTIEIVSTVRKPAMRDIVAAVSDVTGITIAELMSARRARHIARPRQVCCYLAKRWSGLSFPTIGRFLGNRDHTTVMHALRKIDSLREAGDDRVIGWIAAAEDALRGTGLLLSEGV